jgi:hypothetical protein
MAPTIQEINDALRLAKRFGSKSSNDDAENDDDDHDEVGDELAKLTVILSRKGALICFFLSSSMRSVKPNVCKKAKLQGTQ